MSRDETIKALRFAESAIALKPTVPVDVEAVRAALHYLTAQPCAEVTRLTAERDALAQRVEALRQERDGLERRRETLAYELLTLQGHSIDLRDALATAQQDAARLREALEWLVNLGYGVGKGGTPETGEIEAALEHGRAALTAPADPTGGQ